MGKEDDDEKLIATNFNSDNEQLTKNKNLKLTKLNAENSQKPIIRHYSGKVKNYGNCNKQNHKSTNDIEKQSGYFNQKNNKHNNQNKKFTNEEERINSKTRKERPNSCCQSNSNKKKKEYNRNKKSNSLSKDYQLEHQNESFNNEKTLDNQSNRKNRYTTITSSCGQSFNLDENEYFDEPLFDSDDEIFRQSQQKPCLNFPRSRIRTLSGTVPRIGYSPKWGGATMCLCCLQFFDLPNEIAKFANHLLTDHHIVIEEVDYIVDPKRYVEYWRQRFAKESVDKIIPIREPDFNSIYYGKVDYYYEMSERIPEDYSLRQRLAMRRLEEALACQQREREKLDFSMQCIFCRYIARGNRSKIIHHLYMIHHLNLGSPENLIFVCEYVDHLKEKLQNNECLYCEKIFDDRTTLMEHMRKRKHREVNPGNDYYDKFYIINYLELGKRWLDVLAEDFEDTMPTFIDSEDEEEEESWHEWQEDNTDDDQIRAVCIFCTTNSDKIEDILDHINNSHSFDLLSYAEKENLEFYDRIKLLNFLRKQSFKTPSKLLNNELENNKTKPIILPERSQWDNEENLISMFSNDHFVWMFESYIDKKKVLELNLQNNNINKDAEFIDLCSYAIENDWDTINKQYLSLMRQNNSDNCQISIETQHSIVQSYIKASQENTVSEVVAEDWPDLSNSVLDDHELYKLLR